MVTSAYSADFDSCPSFGRLAGQWLSASGFAAARPDDVAKRGGVAKGTIYLYFRDKETLFQELLRSLLMPLIGGIEAMGAASTRNFDGSFGRASIK
jgi:AcrR family transcriptional regulator